MYPYLKVYANYTVNFADFINNLCAGGLTTLILNLIDDEVKLM